MKEDDEFQTFFKTCVREAENKQRQLEAEFHVSRYPHAHFDHAAGIIRFESEHDADWLQAWVTPIGVLSPSTSTWQWAWATDSLVAFLREKAQRLRELAAMPNAEGFSQPTLRADRQIADELTAICVHHLGSVGFYRATLKGDLLFYLALDSMHQMS